jgi:hypothetical protein
MPNWNVVRAEWHVGRAATTAARLVWRMAGIIRSNASGFVYTNWVPEFPVR